MCYRDLEKSHPKPLTEIDKLLTTRKRPDTAVRWLFRRTHPFDDRSQPINRFLASRLMALAEVKSIDLGLTARTNGVTVSPIKGGRYLVDYEVDGTRQVPIVCRQALVRWGAKKYQAGRGRGECQFPAILESVVRVFEDPWPEIVKQLDAFLGEGKTHKQCDLPWAWEADRDFSKLLKPVYPGGGRAPAPPELMAEFVAGFDAPDLDRPDAGRMVYRIRIWLDGLGGRLRVQYDLHPEEENKPITRHGIGPLYEQWLNTRNDYRIRVRSSDGFEWQVGGVLAALRLRYDMPEEQAVAKGADRRARNPVPILADRKGAPLKEVVRPQQVGDAIAQLAAQTQTALSRYGGS